MIGSGYRIIRFTHFVYEVSGIDKGREAPFVVARGYRKTNLAMKIAHSTHRLAEISLYLPVPAFNAT